MAKRRGRRPLKNGCCSKRPQPWLNSIEDSLHHRFVLKIGLNPQSAVLPPPAGLLVTPDRHRHVRNAVAVDPYDPGAQAAAHALDARCVLAPHARREPVLRVVGEAKRFLRLVTRDKDGDRPEYFITPCGASRLRISEDRRLIKEAAAIQGAAASEAFGALPGRSLNNVLDRSAMRG